MITTTLYRARGLAAALLVAELALCAAAAAQDVYDTTTGQLSVADLAIGTLGFQNLVVDVGGIVQPPSGFSPHLPFDVFDPASGQLSISSVDVGPNTFYNPVVSVGRIVSVGSVTGADSYSGNTLSLPAVQILGGALYTGVKARVGADRITGIAGGLPSRIVNTYDPASGTLQVPVAAYNGRYYTNVAATVGPADVISVAGTQPPTTALYAFPAGSGGAGLRGSLLLGTDGNFYGTTRQGGTAGQGTVFQMTPQGVVTVLHSFTGYDSAKPSASDGASPSGRLARDIHGNLYGTTFLGGAYNSGIVYQIAPNGSESVLHAFSGPGGITAVFDGAQPAGGLTLASDGYLYGTTYAGGISNLGTTFRISTSGTEQVLTSFLPADPSVDGVYTDGHSPYSGLVEAPGGKLFYGTTSAGGFHGTGTVFSLSLAQQVDPAHPNAVEEPMVFFGTGASGDGLYPLAGVVQMSDGNLYGTTSAGGAYQAGTVFRVNPTSGTEAVLYSFSGAGVFGGASAIANGPAGSLDGAFPASALVIGPNDVLFGVAQYGGAYGQGTVYSVNLGGQEATVHSFSGGALSGSADGAQPNGILVGTNGVLFGTTGSAGGAGAGIVFKLVPQP